MMEGAQNLRRRLFKKIPQFSPAYVERAASHGCSRRAHSIAHTRTTAGGRSPAFRRPHACVMGSRRRSRSRSSSSSSSQSRSSSSRSARAAPMFTATDARALSDDELLRKRQRLLEALTTEREIARRAKEATTVAVAATKRKRRDSDSEDEEGQIGVGGGSRRSARDDDRPPAKMAKGYVPPHLRRAEGGAGDGSSRRDEGRFGGEPGRSEGEWRRKDHSAAARASQPKIPVPGERGFGFHAVGVGRGRGGAGTSGSAPPGSGAPHATTVRVPPPPAVPSDSHRFADAPEARQRMDVPPPPMASGRVDAEPRTFEPPRPRVTQQVPPPPPRARSPSPPVAKAPSAEKPRRAPEPTPESESESDDDDDNDDIEAIQAAAKVATKVIDVVIPDPPAAAQTTEAPTRRSSRRSAEPEKAPEEAPAPRRSRRSVERESEPAPKASSKSTATTATASGSFTPVEGDPSKLTVVVLKDLLKERGLSTAGLKAALVKRLTAALAEEE